MGFVHSTDWRTNKTIPCCTRSSSSYPGFLLKYATSPRLFVADIKHPLSGSLMAPMSMALLMLCDYLAVVTPIIAYPLWFMAVLLHFTMMVLFFGFQIMNFKMSNIVPSWFLYPVGLISSSLAGSQFGHNVFSETLAMMCIGIYFFMLPLVLYRLVFFGSLPRRARPTLAIMAAPVNLSLAAYLVNFAQPDPILTGRTGRHRHYDDLVNLSVLFPFDAFEISTIYRSGHLSFRDQCDCNASSHHILRGISPALALVTRFWISRTKHRNRARGLGVCWLCQNVLVPELVRTPSKQT